MGKKGLRWIIVVPLVLAGVGGLWHLKRRYDMAHARCDADRDVSPDGRFALEFCMITARQFWSGEDLHVVRLYELRTGRVVGEQLSESLHAIGTATRWRQTYVIWSTNPAVDRIDFPSE